MKFIKNIQKYSIALIIGLIILGCNLFSSQQEPEIISEPNLPADTSLPDTTAQDTPAQILPTRDPVEWYDRINFSLLSFEESPGEDGNKILTFQSVIQNLSNEDWITIHGFSDEQILTADGFSYEKSNQNCYVIGKEKWLESRKKISFSVLPPGTQTLTCLEQWVISEFATEPIKSFSLQTNKGSAEFTINLNPQEVIPYVESPFVNNISWADYKDKYQADVNVLDLGQSIEFDFGTVTFEGFHLLPRYSDEVCEFVIFNVKNASLGYPLDLRRDLSGIAIDGSVGFHLRLESWFQFDDPEYSYVINPGQSNKVAWTMWDVDEILSSLTYWTFNLESSYPYTSKELVEPRCVIIPTISWRREDMRPNFQDTDVNLIVCQD
jgi:hypothetical protein